MKWSQFLHQSAGLPVILSANLRVQYKGDTGLFVQLSRWKKSGRLIPLKKGVFLVDPLYSKSLVFEPFLAQTLLSPSYISLENALSYYGLIPEGVPIITSVTTGQARRFETPAGIFRYDHIHPNHFWGYEPVQQNHQLGFMALPEKALLDFFYIKRRPVSDAYLKELRFQNLERMDLKRIAEFADRFNRPAFSQKIQTLLSYLKSERLRDKSL